ncbi:MAG: ABC transporter substrate-binding protein [Planctomycetia bacterium]|nr:ABC transporter substrate-binding protein [Planctomycetia bacterium]
MIYVGLDDTDVIDSPGTNQLALAIAKLLQPQYHVVRIVRHQLLDDPRVPYTSRNGSASMMLESRDGDADENQLVEELVAELCPVIVAWSPAGSDPGLCVTAHVPASIVSHGLRCQRELVTQEEARAAAAKGIRLIGLGGTEGGVIGALAAVGLAAAADDGRVIYLGAAEHDISSLCGACDIAELTKYGIDQVLEYETRRPVMAGVVELGKKLRPNLRGGRTVLFVEPEQIVEQGNNGEEHFRPSGRRDHWQAMKVR